MDALLMVLVAATLLIISYFSYGRWLSKRVFSLRADSTTPAVSLRDDHDFIPTKKSIVFGHHFTSIAGTGPIVGPAIAVMWGWLPAILWVVFGAIFIGAVHDLGSLVVSLRNKGRTVGDIAGDLLGPRVRTLFLTILIVALWIVLAIFGLVIAAVLKQYPGAIIPVLVQIPLALGIGVFIHRAGKSIFLPSLIALAIMFATVIWGDTGALHTINTQLAAAPTWAWVLALLTYAYIASVLPVWTLLQPRDYINALQLVSALALLVIGLIGAAFFGGQPLVEGAPRVPLELVAPVINMRPAGAPPMIPLLFITIACGAISGFHCLVSSGTTSKQLACETHAQPIAYGSMLTESFLATLVIAACAAGIGLGVTSKVPHYISSFGPTESGESHHTTYLSIHMDKENILGVVIQSHVLPDTEKTAKQQSLRHEMHWDVWSAMKARMRPYPDGTYHGIPSVPGAKNLLSAEPTLMAFDTPIAISVSLPAGELHLEFRDGAFVSVTDKLAYYNKYESWSAAGSLGAKVGAFVDGAANLIAAIGVPRNIALALMGALVASFAGTTMDTACRLQRYVIQELARTFLPKRFGPACRSCGYSLEGLAADACCPECALDDPIDTTHIAARRAAASTLNPFRLLATTHGATAFAVITAAALAFMPAPGQPWSLASAGSGGLLLWPLFGATNQLLGGLAFIVIAAWLIKNKRPWWFIVPPALLMLIFPAWALVLQTFIGSTNMASWWAEGQWLLVTISTFMLAVEIWMIAELWIRLRNGRLGPPADSRADGVDVKTADQGSEFSTGG